MGDKLGPFIDSLPTVPALRPEGGRRRARALDRPIPEEGSPARRLLAEVIDRAAPIGLNTAGPGYFGFIPGGGLPSAALADLVTGVLNRFTGLWMPAPGLVQLEISVIRWLCAEVGLTGPEAGGLLTSGGSLANLGAVVAARARREDWSKAVIYTSSLAHHSALKAALIAGFRREQVRALPVDAAHRLPVGALAAAIRADRAAGLDPLMLIASAGTTAVGSVDPLVELATLSATEDLWFHVDGAYGGCFALTERGRKTLAGMERADSITLDPHKGLFLPYGTGALLVRDLAALRAAFRVDATYLPPPQTDAGAWDFADLGPELSRPARGLRLWLPLHLHGAGAFRVALDEKLDLAAVAAEGVAALPHVRIVAPAALSLFAFRVEPTGAEGDAITRKVLAAVHRRARVFLSGATITEGEEQVFVIRICVLSFRTHAASVEALVADIGEAIREVCS